MARGAGRAWPVIPGRVLDAGIALGVALLGVALLGVALLGVAGGLGAAARSTQG